MTSGAASAKSSSSSSSSSGAKSAGAEQRVVKAAPVTSGAASAKSSSSSSSSSSGAKSAGAESKAAPVTSGAASAKSSSSSGAKSVGAERVVKAAPDASAKSSSSSSSAKSAPAKARPASSVASSATAKSRSGSSRSAKDVVSDEPRTSSAVRSSRGSTTPARTASVQSGRFSVVLSSRSRKSGSEKEEDLVAVGANSTVIENENDMIVVSRGPAPSPRDGELLEDDPLLPVQHEEDSPARPPEDVGDGRRGADMVLAVDEDGDGIPDIPAHLFKGDPDDLPPLEITPFGFVVPTVPDWSERKRSPLFSVLRPDYDLPGRDEDQSDYLPVGPATQDLLFGEPCGYLVNTADESGPLLQALRRGRVTREEGRVIVDRELRRVLTNQKIVDNFFGSCTVELVKAGIDVKNRAAKVGLSIGGRGRGWDIQQSGRQGNASKDSHVEHRRTFESLEALRAAAIASLPHAEELLPHPRQHPQRLPPRNHDYQHRRFHTGADGLLHASSEGGFSKFSHIAEGSHRMEGGPPPTPAEDKRSSPSSSSGSSSSSSGPSKSAKTPAPASGAQPATGAAKSSAPLSATAKSSSSSGSSSSSSAKSAAAPVKAAPGAPVTTSLAVETAAKSSSSTTSSGAKSAAAKRVDVKALPQTSASSESSARAKSGARTASSGAGSSSFLVLKSSASSRTAGPRTPSAASSRSPRPAGALTPLSSPPTDRSTSVLSRQIPSDRSAFEMGSFGSSDIPSSWLERLSSLGSDYESSELSDYESFDLSETERMMVGLMQEVLLDEEPGAAHHQHRPVVSPVHLQHPEDDLHRPEDDRQHPVLAEDRTAEKERGRGDISSSVRIPSPDRPAWSRTPSTTTRPLPQHDLDDRPQQQSALFAELYHKLIFDPFDLRSHPVPLNLAFSLRETDRLVYAAADAVLTAQLLLSEQRLVTHGTQMHDPSKIFGKALRREFLLRSSFWEPEPVRRDRGDRMRAARDALEVVIRFLPPHPSWSHLPHYLSMYVLAPRISDASLTYL